MSITDNHTATEMLSGTIERVTYHNEDNGYCVLKTKVQGYHSLVTVIGHIPSVSPGEHIEGQGSWVQHKEHGLQFSAAALKTIAPSTLEGIEKYLGSGMVKGIGPHFAKKLVKAFQEEVFDVIENQSHRLLELEGIGKKRQEAVNVAWKDQKAIRDIMVFLQAHGVGTARAVRIYKTYGDEAINKVKLNPYRLSSDVHGIGFKTADQLAARLGVDSNALIRAQAGVTHVLQQLCQQGHCAVQKKQLIEEAAKLLEMAPSIIETGIADQVTAEQIATEVIEGESCLYPIALYIAEERTARHLHQLNTHNFPWSTLNTDEEISWVENKTGISLSPSQRQALKKALSSKVAIITGGPGVGKTTLVRSLLEIIRKNSLSVGLCAPTGRAAKRMEESTGLPAKTIHRLLDFDPHRYSFKHNQDNPLRIDVLIMDESSMVDIQLFYQLIKALPMHCALFLVGDIDQLPSVGPGSVLSDLIRSNTITTVRLTEVFRQAESSQIIVNAHRVNQGNGLLKNQGDGDFFTLYIDDPSNIHDELIEIIKNRLPSHYDLNPITDIQVLTPMNRGNLGTRNLNQSLQQALNRHSEPKVSRFGQSYSPGDKVIQMVNNYDKSVFNGDIGFVSRINLEDKEIVIRFDQQAKTYGFDELDEVSLAYAISIHKSQGSEFPVVIIPLCMQHYMLLSRKLLYTGMTRGKNLVIIMGEKKAISMAIANNKDSKRLTYLQERLRKLN